MQSFLNLINNLKRKWIRLVQKVIPQEKLTKITLVFSKLLPLLFIISFLSYIALIRNELKISSNNGNIKIVAAKTKDSKSNGYMENIRTVLIDGTPLEKKQITRNEWNHYGGTAIPIIVGNPSDEFEQPTLEIQAEQPIRNLFFEYSRYEIGGHLQVFIDDQLVKQINTYQEELTYEPLFIQDSNQYYGINQQTIFWWGQCFLFGFSLFFFLKRKLYHSVKFGKILALASIFLGGYFILKIVIGVSSSDSFVFSNTLFNLSTATQTLFFLATQLLVVSTTLSYLKGTRLAFVVPALYISLLLPTPFLAHHLLEAPAAFDSYLDPSTTSLNIIIISIVWLCLCLISTSIRLGSSLLIAITATMGIVNKILIHLRSTPLLAYFFLQIFDGLNIVKNTSITLTHHIPSLVFLSLVYILHIGMLPSFGTWLMQKYLINRASNHFPKIKPFIIPIVQKIVLAISGVLFSLYIARPYIYHIANKVDIELRFFSMQKTFYEYGFALSFFRFEEVSHITKPEGYSNSKVEQILSEFPRIDESSNKYPNIIIIQNEALTDYSTLTDLTFNTDPLEYIHSLKENTIQGATYMSVLGGATANSEYEVLTSNSLGILPPNSFPFQQHIHSKRNSFANALNTYGYRTVGIHPYVQNFYRRNTVYPHLGFQEAYFNNSSPSISDLGEIELLRNYVSDQSLYNISHQIIEETEEPVFQFIVTMQGHESYGIPEELSPRTVTTTNAQANEAMTDFLSSVKASDDAFKDLTQKLQNSSEPTVVIMYGDHHPNITPTYFAPYLDGNDPSSQYQTPFVLWTNFDLPETNNIRLSANYVVPYLLQTLSQTDHALPISSYYQFLSEVQKEIPILTAWGNYDTSFTYSENPPQSELYQQYQMVQYNNVIDKKSIQMTEYYQ